jgi:hypothetical protein
MTTYMKFTLPEGYLDAYHKVKPLIEEFESKHIPNSGKPVPYLKGKMTPKQLRSRNKSKAAKRKRK